MNQDETKIKKIKNRRLGLLIGSAIWFFILIASIIAGFIFSLKNIPINRAVSYIGYVITMISFSTSILIGIYLFNRDNVMIKKLLKIDITWLFAGILMAIMETTLNQNYHAYNEYLPSLIYMFRLMIIYMYIDNIADDSEKFRILKLKK